MLAIRDLVGRVARADWFWRCILIPFVLSRGLLAFLVWISQAFAGAPLKNDCRETPFVLLKLFAKWDACWYASIVAEGYLPGPLSSQNRIAFLPGYPYLVRAIHTLMPEAWRGFSAMLAIGIVISNLAALAGLAVLYRHVRDRFCDPATAGRAIIYVLAFPTAFFLSGFYTESLFFLLVVASFDAAWRGRWLLAVSLGTAATLTRPTGLLLVAPLAWLYLERAGWSLRHLRPEVLCLAFLPLAYVGYGFYCWRLTGDPLAVLHVQKYWGKAIAAPWTTLFDSHPPGDIDSPLTMLAIAAALLMFWKLPSPSYGILTLLIIASFLFTGTARSGSRYLLAAFPLFILAARAGMRPAFERAYLCVAISIQAAMMITWNVNSFVA